MAPLQAIQMYKWTVHTFDCMIQLFQCHWIYLYWATYQARLLCLHLRLLGEERSWQTWYIIVIGTSTMINKTLGLGFLCSNNLGTRWKRSYSIQDPIRIRSWHCLYESKGGIRKVSGKMWMTHFSTLALYSFQLHSKTLICPLQTSLLALIL